MAAATRPPNRPPTREIDEQTDIGEVYMRSLLRAQLRRGLTVLAVVALFLAALPLLFTVEPRLASVRILTVPLPWLLLGVTVYPLLLAASWWLVRAAERTERDFAELVERD
jgi:hypothetical protein